MKRAVLWVGWVLCITIGADGAARYVWLSSPTPQAPYTSPDTAGHDIQTVVDVCVDGDTVLAYPGIYESGGRAAVGMSLTNRVCITNAVTLMGLGNTSNTVIQGAADPGGDDGNGAASVRGVCISGGATVSGFRIVEGHTLSAGDATRERSGGGALVEDGAVLEDCRIESCAADDMGAGAACLAGGTIRNTRIAVNQAYDGGGGVLLQDGALVERCRIASNVSTNTGDDGGGVFLSTGGTLRNCLVVGNVSLDNGGGIYAATAASGTIVENCTIVGNTAGDNGGGIYVYSGTYANNIIVDNACGLVYTNWRATAGNRLTYCCTVPKPTGEGCIDDNPQFAGADYRLSTNSPCIDAGQDRPGIVNDLEGTPRPLDGDANGVTALDMGCYEIYNAAGDSDGDGMTDGNEGIADTDPTDAKSVLRILAISNNSPVTVYFESSVNRLYSLQGRSALTADDWAEITGKAGTGGSDALTDTNEPPRGPFYRLGVTRP